MLLFVQLASDAVTGIASVVPVVIVNVDVEDVVDVGPSMCLDPSHRGSLQIGTITTDETTFSSIGKTFLSV